MTQTVCDVSSHLPIARQRAHSSSNAFVSISCNVWPHLLNSAPHPIVIDWFIDLLLDIVSTVAI